MMLIIYILLALVIFLQILVLFRSNASAVFAQLPQLHSTLSLMPELIKEKLGNILSENNHHLIENNHVNNQALTAAFNQFQVEILKQENLANANLLERFSKFASEQKQTLNEDVAKLNQTLRSELEKMNSKVEDRLKEGFENTSKTFSSVLERLTKIDEAQKKIDALSSDIVSLQDILTDKKSRGIFGEVQLNQILVSIFGENSSLFAIQHKLTSGTIVDVALFAPQPMGTLCIDSKFPLENYKRMVQLEQSEFERQAAKKDFESNVKKHIDDIANKYIIVNDTSNQAVMFLPAEAIFAQINAYHGNLIDYAQKRNVWLASPTTLMAMLTTIQVVIKNLEQAKHAKVIQEHLAKLSDEFTRYKFRWDNLAKHIDTVAKDVKDIHTTTEKIDRRFNEIAQVEIIDK